MTYATEFRRCLEDLDVATAQRLWRHVSPHLPQPTTDAETLIMLHRARTEANSIPLKLRAYSHRWLEDQGLPSGLPDNLKRAAERIYPRIVEGVGISVNFKAPDLKPVATLIRRAMEDVVEDAYAEGRTDPAFVKARMTEARKTTLKKLLG